MTERVIAAIENPLVDCIGHLTGRLIGRREPYDIDVETVAEAAAADRDDARDQRQPQPPRPLRAPRPPRGRRRRARSASTPTPTASTPSRNIDYGIATARRGWLTRRRGGEHAAVGEVREAAQALPLSRSPDGSLLC